MNTQETMLKSLDHIAIVVHDTEKALEVWRDKVGLKYLYSEVVNQNTVRLTHLDMGNCHLQLVEPLTPDHPLQKTLQANGPTLHHFCFKVDDVAQTFGELPKSGLNTAPKIHQGTQGKKALFIDKNSTQGIQIEVTGT